MTIEIVDFPIKHGDFPVLWDSLPEGMPYPPFLGHPATPGVTFFW
jgi:hypothetical protein